MSAVQTQQAFDAVARYYDEQLNPLLALEERYLSGLLPSVRKMDVVELGCGTGRWLRKLRGQRARTLTGVDASEEMLAAARVKLGDAARLERARAEQIPLPGASADVVVLPFVLSYCVDLAAVAGEVARIGRPGAMVFVSDVHPETESQLGWRRTFSGDSGTVAMSTERHAIADVVKHFERAGFACVTKQDLPFGHEEAEIFKQAGKLDALKAIGERPAVYILQFAFPATRARTSTRLGGANVAVSASSTVRADVEVASGKVCGMALESSSASQNIELNGMMILPGLINAHDHLEFGLYPNLGGGTYRNAREWAHAIQANEKGTIARHEGVPKAVRLHFGGLRNLLCGVTTVCHHNPQAEIFRSPDFPVRVAEVDWAHSLAFDRAGVERFAQAERVFAVHVAEGTDEASCQEIAEMGRLGLLSEHAVLVHALACSADDVEKINEGGTAVVACPSSNQFLYGRTISQERVRGLRRVALGTDSPLTAGGDLLDEIRTACDAWELSADELYAMVTSHSADVLSLHDGSGRIHVNGRADFLVVRDDGRSPAEQLVGLRPEAIELVVIAGRVHLASEAKYGVLPDEFKAGLEPLLIEVARRWVRAPLAWMFEAAEAVLGKPLVLGGKRVAYAG